MSPRSRCRIDFNFVRSCNEDIAFHLNPRVKEEIVVRNSQLGGRWGSEEREIDFNPFREGEYFDVSSCCVSVASPPFTLLFLILPPSAPQMSIRCGREKYKVFVNGKHLCSFHHRVSDFREIDMLEIYGDVEISYIHF